MCLGSLPPLAYAHPQCSLARSRMPLNSRPLLFPTLALPGQGAMGWFLSPRAERKLSLPRAPGQCRRYTGAGQWAWNPSVA